MFVLEDWLQQITIVYEVQSLYEKMLDWYDIIYEKSLSIFLCYAAQEPKKYHLYVFVSEETDDVPSLRSDKECVKGNDVKRFGENFENYFC